MAQFPLFTGPNDLSALRAYLNQLVNAINNPTEFTTNMEVDGTLTVDGTAEVTGNFSVNTNKFTVAAASGNTIVAGTENVVGDFSVATTKFTVAASTGNVAVAGTENVVGDFSVATSKFNVTASSGNTSAAGTLTGTLGVKSTLNAGTPGTGVTAVEWGDGYAHTSVLTVSTTLPAIAGGANLAVGKLMYTLPAGAQVYNVSYMSIGITQTQGHINADTPEVGLGTVIAVGAVATLDGTGTFEDIITGQVAANCTGTATVATAIPTAGVPFVTAVAGSKAVYLNVADGWAASGDAAALIAGTIVLHWQFMH